jgi:chromosome segregation ATPase
MENYDQDGSDSDKKQRNRKMQKRNSLTVVQA